MRIARFISQDKTIQYGWIDEDRIGTIQGNPFGEYRRFEAKQKLNEVKLLAPPCEPSKIIVVAHNFAYKSEKELTPPPPDYPIFFPLNPVLL